MLTLTFVFQEEEEGDYQMWVRIGQDESPYPLCGEYNTFQKWLLIVMTDTITVTGAGAWNLIEKLKYLYIKCRNKIN